MAWAQPGGVRRGWAGSQPDPRRRATRFPWRARRRAGFRGYRVPRKRNQYRHPHQTVGRTPRIPGSVTAGVAASALMAAVALVLLAVVAAVLLALGDRTVATHHRTLLLIGHGQSPRLGSHNI